MSVLSKVILDPPPKKKVCVCVCVNGAGRGDSRTVCECVPQST